MYFSRVMFGSASLLALFLLSALETSGRDEGAKTIQFLVPCTTTIDVDPNQPGGVNPPDAYICTGTNVNWRANKHKFKVFFKNGKCPFSTNCRGINDQQTSVNTVGSFTAFTVFSYGILVDDDWFDPHVVGGGGARASDSK